MSPRHALKTVNILLVEDDLAEARLLQEVLKNFKVEDFCLTHVKRLQQAKDHLEQAQYDVVLLDLTLPDSIGLNSLREIKQSIPSIPIVVLTNHNDEKFALEAVRAGAQDYLVKRKINVEGLVRSLQYAIERQRVAETMRQANKDLSLQIERARNQLLEAQKNDQLRAEFLSMFSHEFRNPLTTILASSGLLEQRQANLTTETQQLLLQQIHAAGKGLAQLIDEIIFLGRSDAGKLAYEPKLLDIEAYLSQKVTSLQLTVGNQHQLKFTSKGDFTNTLWDTSLLQHIIDNLLINAIKYSPVDSLIELSLTKKLELAILEVRDRGIGMSSEYLPKLFIPFQRADNARNIPGTGLGLSIVKRCVEVQSGKIDILSQKDQGTTVTITLPIKNLSSQKLSGCDRFIDQ